MKSLLRWWIGAVLCAAITLSYLDRQTLSLAVGEINSHSIPISDSDFATLNSCFLFTYALMYVGGGKLMDEVGIRFGFLAIMVIWSLAVIGHGFVFSFFGLAVCRCLLGFGEGGGFPAATKTVAEWFPARERSTAMGLINAGTALGGIIAPPLAAAILSSSRWPDLGLGLADPWRWVFFLAGSCGLVWCLVWLWTYFPLDSHPRISEVERARLLAERSGLSKQSEAAAQSLVAPRSFYRTEVAALMACKFLGDAVWYFITFWLPKYLMDVRGFNIKKVGAFAWLPWLGAGIGCLIVGYFSSWLIGKGADVIRSRKIALGVAVSVMPSLYFVPQLADVHAVVWLFFVAYLGQQAWSTLVMTLPTDLVPAQSLGTVAGLVGFSGAMGGIVFGQVAGWYLDAHPRHYAPIFVVASTLHVISWLVICLFIRNRGAGNRSAD